MVTKAQQANQDDFIWIFEQLKKTLSSNEEANERNVIDELVFNLLLRGSTQQRTQSAFNVLKDEFHDWNEVRVTIPGAIENCIKGIGLEKVKSLRLVKILQGIFDDRSEVDLEFLHEMSTPAVSNYLGNMDGIGNNTVETVLTCALNKHIFPVTTSVLRFSKRFGFIKSVKGTSNATKVKNIVEASIPEGQLSQLIYLMDLHTDTCCRSDKPRCSDCPLASKCKWALNIAKT